MSTLAIPEVSEQVRLQPLYHVILIDDQDHSYDYVIEMLGKVFGHGLAKAFEMAREVDLSGCCVVYTGPLEHAEVKRDGIHGYGKDWRIPRCAGSMSASLEPADA